ncbi:MAG: hypothetical protein JW795_14980 [Chitinivibrionales bacterium]|nr:hypothetical protein [Chitinivibrionales bacterium]
MSVTWVSGADLRQEAILNAYKNTDNTVSKRRTLQRLSFGMSAADSVESWKKELLSVALREKNPLIVEEAARQIQKMRLQELSPILMEVLTTAETRFGGYASRVQVALISALGTAGGENVPTYLGLCLERDTGSILAPDLLLAIKDLKSPLVIDKVEEFCRRMEQHISRMRERNLDSIYYSTYQMYMDLGRDVITTLTELIRSE